jgi:hypothetical protein
MFIPREIEKEYHEKTDTYLGSFPNFFIAFVLSSFIAIIGIATVYLPFILGGILSLGITIANFLYVTIKFHKEYKSFYALVDKDEQDLPQN